MSAGQLNQLSLAKESTWGTAVTPSKSIPVHFTGGIKTDQDLQMISAARANLAKNLDSFVGKRVHEGDLEMDFFSDYPGYFVVAALGAVASALKGGESVVYEHTITEQEAKPSYTIEQVVGENVRRFAGCLITGFKLSCNTGEPVVLAPSIKAKSQASATKITPTYLTNRAFNWADCAFKIGGVIINEVISFELEYSNNLELLHSLAASNDPQFQFVKGSEVKGKFECYLDSTTLAELNDYLSKTNNALDLVVTGDAIGVSANHKIEISIPKVFYTAADTELGEDYNLVSVEFEGVYDSTTAKLLSVKLTNLLANYN